MSRNSYDELLENVKSIFADKAIIAKSVFNPSLYPLTKDSLPSYGNEHIKTLTEFYRKEAEVEYAGMTYTSSSLLDGDKLLSEWKIFRCALLLEKKAIMECKKNSPYLQVCKIFLTRWKHYLVYGGNYP